MSVIGFSDVFNYEALRVVERRDFKRNKACRGSRTLTDTNLTDPVCPSLNPAQIKASVARALISALSSECKTYCLLSGYDSLPNSFDTDIDFMVDRYDFKRMPAIMEKIAQQTNTHLFHSVEHELTAQAFLLMSLSGVNLTIAQLDAASDYRHFGSLWLRASEVLAARRMHPRGFWIPSAGHEFAYCLIKRLNKRKLSQPYGSRIHRLYKEDRHSCEKMIARFWKGSRQRALSRMAATDDWSELAVGMEPFRRELMRNTAESPLQIAVSRLRRALHFVARIARPTGAWIAFVGPDGSGKSLVISRVHQQFEPAFRGVATFHMRPKFLSRRPRTAVPVTDPHGEPLRGSIASMVKLIYYGIDYSLGYLFQIMPALIRTRMILFDRYIYDLQVDTRRIRYGGPKWLLGLIALIVPRPDLVVLLDAPAEVLWPRKQEVPLDEVARQRSAYLKVARALPFAIVVNAAQPVADVVHDAAKAILTHFTRRSAQRLKLRVFPLRSSESEPVAPSELC